MKLVITAEHHFLRLPDGSFWAAGSMTYPFWERYLAVFDEVAVVARSHDVAAVSGEYARIDGPGVGVHALPDYTGPIGYLRVRREFGRRTAAAVQAGDAVLLRVGCSPLGATVESMLDHTGHPFGVEVITDPEMVFAPGAVRHPLRPVFRRMFTRQLERQCRSATAATYVTRDALQQRYPAGTGAYATHFSDVDLPAEAFVPGARTGALVDVSTMPTIVSIGSMAQVYKGFDVLIDAVARAIGDGLALRLVLVGDGRHRPDLEARAQRLGIGPHVTFTGQLAGGGAVRDQFDRADLFVLASRTEGLPRVVVEAQARGLPCVGTGIGGIPELLDDTALVPAEDAAALAAAITRAVTDPAWRARQSARNLEVARHYGNAVLQERRVDFLKHLRARTEAWQARAAQPRPRSAIGRMAALTGKW